MPGNCTCTSILKYTYALMYTFVPHARVNTCMCVFIECVCKCMCFLMCYMMCFLVCFLMYVCVYWVCVCECMCLLVYFICCVSLVQMFPSSLLRSTKSGFQAQKKKECWCSWDTNMMVTLPFVSHSLFFRVFYSRWISFGLSMVVRR